MPRSERAGAAHDVAFHAPHIGPLLHSDAALPTGGAETQIAITARELARRGVRVAIVVNDTSLPPSIDGIDLVHQPPAQGPAWLRPLRNFGRTFRAVRRANAPVVVQCNASADTGYVAFAARLTGRRLVFHTVNVVDFDFSRIEPNRARRGLYRLGVRLAHEIVGQTQEQVDLAAERFGRRALLARSVSEPARTPRRPPEAFLWIGRLARYKRPHAYLDLAAALPEARFWMVAVPAGPDARQLAEEIEQRASAMENVELLPPRPRGELGSLYAAAVAVVNTAEFEGMPNIFLEGWAHGAPALAERHDPDGMIVREGLGRFADGDPARMEALARSLWGTRDTSGELEAHCIDYVRRHHSLDALIDVWQEILLAQAAKRGPRPRNASSPRAADAADA